MMQREAISKPSSFLPLGRSALQAKLRIGKADDAYEREADQVADRVMRMPEPNVQHSVQRSAQGIQRMCAGCKDEEDTLQRKEDEEEETLQRKEDEEEEETLQRKEAGSSNGPASAPAIVHDVLSGSGSPLDASVRSYMEPRFGHDFSQVRVHSGSRAAESASAVNALAYTVGNNVVFNRGAYSPESASGKRLIAHELTHVVQQGGGKRGIASKAQPTMQRKVIVNSRGVDEIVGHFNKLCPAGKFKKKGRTVVPNAPCAAGTKSCECVCDATQDKKRKYWIDVRKISNRPRRVTLHDGTRAVIPSPSQGPRTRVSMHPHVHLPSDKGPAIRFGSFTPAGTLEWAPTWRILGHELCSHGRLMQHYGHEPSGNRPSHDVTIDVENQIASEHGGPARGKFGDPRQGESCYGVPGDPKVVFKQVDGIHYEVP